MKRRKTKVVRIGQVKIGGNNPIVVQGMIKTEIEDTAATIAQSKKLIKTGAKIIKIALPGRAALKGLSKIKDELNTPLVADVPFNYKLVSEALKQGIDKLTVNPENMSKEEMQRLIKKAKKRKVCLGIKINSSLLDKKYVSGREKTEEYQSILAKKTAKSALNTTKFLEKEGFSDIIIHLKTPDVLTDILSYQFLSNKIPYPFHLEIPATGSSLQSIIRSSITMGTLLSQGIGDIIRVSLPDDPVEEIKISYEILKSLSLYNKGPVLVSCPICGRCHADLERVVRDVLSGIEEIEAPLKIAIMGCEVNGPGEAKDADIGIACTRDGGILFKKGKPLRKIRGKDLAKVLIEEVKKMSYSSSSPIKG